MLQVQVKAPTAAESAALNVGFDEALQFAVVGGAKAATGQMSYTGFQILQSTEPDFAVPTKTVSQKFSSRPVRAVAGLLIGLLLGTLVALARGLLDKRVTSAKRAQAALGYPVVAELPAESSDSARPIGCSGCRCSASPFLKRWNRATSGSRERTWRWTRVPGPGRNGEERCTPTAPRTVARPDARTARGPQRGDGHLPGFGTVPGHRCGQLGHCLRRDRTASGGGDHRRPRCPRGWTGAAE